MKILVTGGFGFIGTNFIIHTLETRNDIEIINFDAMTYAARPAYLERFLKNTQLKEKHTLVIGDLTDARTVDRVFNRFKPEHVFHFAAESHVCRSIAGPKDFIYSNVIGTFNLLEAAREYWANKDIHRFIHISTDEVFGEALDGSKFNENTQVKPRSPYAASKASSDHLVMAWANTYGIDVRITNCSNNFGPNQHEEKLIPKTIQRLLHKKPITLYQDGTQIRDWIYVREHCEALWSVFNKGSKGERYCIGGDMELSNIEIVKKIAALMQVGSFDIEYTQDRPTDDKRYAIDSSKIKLLGWKPNIESFDSYLEDTIEWYKENE